MLRCDRLPPGGALETSTTEPSPDHPRPVNTATVQCHRLATSTVQASIPQPALASCPSRPASLGPQVRGESLQQGPTAQGPQAPPSSPGPEPLPALLCPDLTCSQQGPCLLPWAPQLPASPTASNVHTAGTASGCLLSTASEPLPPQAVPAQGLCTCPCLCLENLTLSPLRHLSQLPHTRGPAEAASPSHGQKTEGSQLCRSVWVTTSGHNGHSGSWGLGSLLAGTGLARLL